MSKLFSFLLISLLTLTTLNLSYAQMTGDTDDIDSSCLNLSYNLRFRSRDINTNNEVSDLQDFLIGEGYMTGNTTGYYGLATQKAVKSFQKNNNLISSGIVGSVTRGKIKSVSCKDASSAIKLENIYTNKALGFAINYPKILAMYNDKKSESFVDYTECNKQEWEYVESISTDYSEVSFGPKCSKSGGYIVSVSVYTNKSKDQIIKDIGTQFKDRNVISKNINVDGKPATLVTVTTSELKGWSATALLIEDDKNRVISISGDANNQALFTKFYNSFKFIK